MDFPELLKVIFLGVVEGITEWLPISSTGHMLLIDAFVPLNMSESFKEMFMVVIQFGAIIAVVTMFWDRVFPFQFKKRPTIKKEVISLWGKIVVSCVPTGILGILFDDFLEQYFGTAQTIAIMLIVYGLAFIVVETWNKKRTPAVNSTKEISYNTAVFFGVFQALAMIPGTSRSGSTIIGALLIGVSRATAAEFSFFLAIPTMLGASVFKLIKFGFSFSTVELQALLIGMTVAFAVSLLVLKLIMKYIQKHDFKIFGWYRIILGIVVLILFKTKV
ncbi:undecaprenyl-diphosphate phosphatase [Hydrogenoanaerobacterium sp.]|uniref:undecaprenyl-diphosphate phosphatase n=1 Tax=Hydrogenoanaerobacterium sp. TaxID=2953763 RepID=UPI00289F2362|nr:undecaprenyl-diphosphate phosphatase [Hydrogenoanaerobacterium sp.]